MWTLSRYAKFVNTPEEYEKLKKWVDAHNIVVEQERPPQAPEVNIQFNPKEIEKTLQAAIIKTLDKHFK